ncbi:helix-turn-helix domain-containing protein [uncultured Clostridium sp.]|uniref:helix-turn-helix domain-containing protein n=1 Tax=uncultured Clostridium sp. TaxID=59620 RepID=UPI002673196A|nr:helix-turn-helix domain-containing protein [uncultured Clostridium sp.]
MGRKFKCLPEDKIQAAKDYLSGRKSTKKICSELGIRYNTNKGNIVRIWARKYQELGEMSFYDKPYNKSYSSRLKIEAVESYLRGEGSKQDICFKYEILSPSILGRWIKKYNRNIELKDYKSKWEVYMPKGRKTSKEERVEIVKYCINNERNYKEAADKYKVSYNQVYTWVKKYDSNGDAGLLYTNTIFDTLDLAIESNPGAKPLVHSDRGFQYTHKLFQKKIQKNKMIQSMSRVGCCLDNAPTEGFWGIIKYEMYYNFRFENEDELRRTIKDYIYFYNNNRYQERFGNLAPIEVR